MKFTVVLHAGIIHQTERRRVQTMQIQWAWPQTNVPVLIIKTSSPENCSYNPSFFPSFEIKPPSSLMYLPHLCVQVRCCRRFLLFEAILNIREGFFLADGLLPRSLSMVSMAFTKLSSKVSLVCKTTAEHKRHEKNEILNIANQLAAEGRATTHQGLEIERRSLKR